MNTRSRRDRVERPTLAREERNAMATWAANLIAGAILLILVLALGISLADALTQ